MIRGNEAIASLFGIFHDGSLTEIMQEGSDLRLKVEIEYLAELVDPANDHFYMTLHNVRHFVYYDYPERTTVLPAVVTDLETIAGFEPQILSARMQDDLIQVAFSPWGRSFGKLLLSADAATVRDEGGNLHTYEQMVALAKEYWESK